jgi:ComF family protein
MPLLASLYRFSQQALRLLYPPKCVFCRTPLTRLEEEAGICAACQTQLPRTRREDLRYLEETLCPCRFSLWYRDRVQESILRYKFSGLSYYHRCYGSLLRKTLLDAEAPPPDYVTWAPLSRQRLRKRGYDQAGLLAQEAARLYGQRPLPLLKKVRHTKPQSSLTARQRQENAKDAYAYCGSFPLLGARVLLVDDVVTTGSTLDNCAKVLLAEGAAEVDCLALAGSVHGRD